MIKKTNYEIQAEKAVLEFPKWDHEKIAKKFDLKYDEDYLYINFLSQEYRLNRHTGSIEKPDKDNIYINANYNEVMSILDLFDYSKDNLKLSGKWSTPNSLKGTINGGHVDSNSTMFLKYENFFSGNIELLKKACEKLNGREIPEGDVGYIIDVFDCLPVKFIFYDEDCDFPPEIKILWDENVLDYMHFETTFFVISHLFERLKEIITEGN